MRASIRNGILVILVALSSTLVGQDQEKSAHKPRSSNSKDESTIRGNVEAFVKAYNAHDAKAVAGLFSPEAHVIDEDGETTQGRDAIEKRVAGTFAESPHGRIKLDVESIRFVGSALAIEIGKSTVTPSAAGTPDISTYTAVHLKSSDGRWLIGFVRETEDSELTNHERLMPLEWLVGDWIDESPDPVVITSCKWSDNKNFLLSDINIRVQGSNAMHLTQRIGWDPLTVPIGSIIDTTIGRTCITTGTTATGVDIGDMELSISTLWAAWGVTSAAIGLTSWAAGSLFYDTGYDEYANPYWDRNSVPAPRISSRRSMRS